MNIDACMNRKQRLLSNQSPTHRDDQWTNQNSRASCHTVRVKRGKTAVTRLVFSLLLIGPQKINSATLVSSELITCKGVLTVFFKPIQFKTMRESLTELYDCLQITPTKEKCQTSAKMVVNCFLSRGFTLSTKYFFL